MGDVLCYLVGTCVFGLFLNKPIKAWRKITKASYVTEGFTDFSACDLDGFLPNYEIDADAIILSAKRADWRKCFTANSKWTAIKITITINQN